MDVDEDYELQDYEPMEIITFDLEGRKTQDNQPKKNKLKKNNDKFVIFGLGKIRKFDNKERDIYLG